MRKTHLSCLATLVTLAACSVDSSTESEPVIAIEEATIPAAVQPAAADEPPPTAAPADEILTVSAIGDCTLGDPVGAERAPGSFHKLHLDTGEDLTRPFSGVIEVLDSDDLTIANLEGTLTTAGCKTDVAFAFRGSPEFGSMLAKGSVELVSLANNHSFDCGIRGFADTKTNLEAAGVGYFGVGTVDVRTVKGIEVVNLGYLGGRIDVREEMKAAVEKHKRPDNLVIVSFHWGIEGIHTATNVQQALGRAAIGSGADLVLGHHPHVLQGIEQYQGKSIVYSLGNFVFGGNAHPSSLDSMIFQARFRKQDGKVVSAGHEIIPVAFSGHPSQNDFRPVLLEGEPANRIRADVERYSRLLGD